MKKISSLVMISLIVLSMFFILAPQIKAESDENLTPENPYADTEPSWSPDGAKIVYHAYAGSWYRHIWVMNNDGGNKTNLSKVEYPSGNVVDVGPAFSSDGTKIAFSRHGFRGDYFDLMIMDADGENVRRITDSTTVQEIIDSSPVERAGSFEAVRWSEDGTKLLFHYNEGTTAPPYYGWWIGTINVDGTNPEVLGHGREPKFCYGDTKILFNTDEYSHEDGRCLALMNVDGTGREILTDGPADSLPDISSITHSIVFVRYGDLYIMNEDGTIIGPVAEGTYPEWSPDEKYIAYYSEKSGNPDIWKMEAPRACMWISTTPLPNPSSAHHCAVHDNRIYVIGGYKPPPPWHERYDRVLYGSVQPDGHIDPDGWQYTTALPDGRAKAPVVVYEDWIYVLGGTADPPGRIERDTVWYAQFNSDGAIGSWKETTSLPYRSPEAAVQWNGRIYIMGGWDGYSDHDDVCYTEINPDGSLSGWTETTSLPERVAHGHAVAVHNGVIYLIGGSTAYPFRLRKEVHYATIQESGEVGTWTETAPLPIGVHYHSIVVYGDDIFVIGGFINELDVPGDAVYKAHINPDGSLDSWQEWCKLPEPLALHCSVVLNGRIYVIGGRLEDSSLVDTVYFTCLVPLPVPATVDIDPDTLNLKSSGQWITAYIQLPEGYDVSDILVDTVMLEDTIAADWGEVQNGTLMVKFDRISVISYIYNVLEIKLGDVTLTASGQLSDGTLFEGSDTIRVIFAGDVNTDGKVNVIDLAIIGRSYGAAMGEPSYHERADLNSDEIIDIADLVITATNYGAKTPQ